MVECGERTKETGEEAGVVLIIHQEEAVVVPIEVQIEVLVTSPLIVEAWQPERRNTTERQWQRKKTQEAWDQFEFFNY